MKNEVCTSPAAQGRIREISTGAAFCLTIYNEPCSVVRESFDSILRGIVEIVAADAAGQSRFAIALIIDGKAAADSALISWLEASELFEPSKGEFVNGARWFSTSHHLGPHLKFGTRAIAEVSSHSVLWLDVIVCLKEQNRGKLDSHRLFFGILCKELNPSICFQMDAGTILELGAAQQIMTTFMRSSDVAAVAPQVMPRLASGETSFLIVWQYCDFAFRNAVGWPFEAATGYLSVIPGQTSAVRWSALEGLVDPGDCAPPHSTPLDDYLNDAQSPSPVRKLMYLAEDRVLALNITFARGHARKLAFLPSASVTTDACEDWGELLRQRRRWTNSALACRVWYWREAVLAATQKGRTVGAKSLLAIAGIAQFGMVLREVLAPAVVVGFLWTIFDSLGAQGQWQKSVALFAAITIAADLVLIVTLGRNQYSLSRRKHLSYGALVVTASACLGFILFAACLPVTAAVLLFAPALAIASYATVLPGKKLIHVLRMQFSPIQSLLMFVGLTGYAFVKIHDTSWGTKGLKHSPENSSSDSKLKRLRNVTLGIWLAANATLAHLLIPLPGIVAPSLNPLVEIFCVLELLFALVALTFHLSRQKLRCHSKKPGSS